jgi:hypothetical protein
MLFLYLKNIGQQRGKVVVLDNKLGNISREKEGISQESGDRSQEPE